MADKSEIRQLPVEIATKRPAPKRIMRPCDWGLVTAINGLEIQVGSVEAYNKLCDAAETLKAKIDDGKGTAAHPMWATDPKFIYPAS